MLAVIVVSWNTRDLTLAALRSLYDDLEASDLAAEVYVVDSGSTDGSPEAIAAAFPQVKLIVSAENIGFGRANNLALDALRAGGLPDAVYLLNSDTITQPHATRTLYESLLANETIGLAGAQLSYADGRFQPSAFTFPDLRQLWVELFPTPGRLYESAFNGRYPRQLYEQMLPFPVDFVLGATMMLRREAIEHTGGFDERFFMYCEEIDWAWRIHDAGWQVCCVPAARVTHLGGASTGQVRPRSVVDLWTSRLMLFERHYPAWKRWIARGMIALGMMLKQHQTGDPALRDAYRSVQRLALKRG